MDKVLTLIEHAPFSGIGKIWITGTEYLLLYTIIIAVFYFLYDQRSWLLKLILCCMLILVCIISFKRWHNLQSGSITFLNLRKHTGIIFRTGDKAVVVSDLSDTDKTYRYSVQPYLDSCQVNIIHKAATSTDIQLPFLLKKTNLIQFGNKKLLIFDKQLQSIMPPVKLKLDYLFISGNPGADIDFINKYYDYGLLIIDNNNSNTLITSLENRAKVLHINYSVLQRNKSIVLSSN
jgi:competence protein ComEC